MLVRLLLVVLLVGATAAQAAAPGPIPPRQSALQQQIYNKWDSQAAIWSEEATPALLEYLAGAEFRSGIRNLPFANESAAVVLDIFLQAVWQVRCSSVRALDR